MARLNRYRLVCRIREARRCHWRSRSWRSVGPFDCPPEAFTAARTHMHDFHPERDDIFDAPITRRWRPWLRWAALLISLAAAVLTVWQLALLARGGTRVDELLWRPT